MRAGALKGVFKIVAGFEMGYGEKMNILSTFKAALLSSVSFCRDLWTKINSFSGKALSKKSKKKIIAPEIKTEDEAPLSSAPPSTRVRQYEEHPSSAYMELKYRFRDVGRMGAIAETMGRDFLTAMPEGAWKSRLGQIAFMHRRMHDDLTNDEMRRLLDRAKDHIANHEDDWDVWDKANLREMEATHDLHAPLTCELTEKRARLSYEGRRRHRDALKNGDWPDGREFLSSVVDMNRQVAEMRGRAIGTNSYYQALVSEYMPGIQVMQIEEWFDDLGAKLNVMLPKILDKQSNEAPPVDITDFYPAKAQMWLNHALLEAIGFDFQRGGLYETGHNPVEGGTPDDTRLVIKTVAIDNFLDSMKSALHEGGHGIYIQGLPRTTWRYQPVGQDMGAAVHESQALLVEMIIGRTKNYFDFLAPRVEGLFHGLHNPMLSAENLHKIKTRVAPSVLRKKADEVTYFFHMQQRFRLERDMMEGTLKPADLPEAWNAGLQDVLGIQPDNVRDGCLQDVHWFVGKFGYFPSYTIGHMLAAQLYETIQKDIPDSRAHISQGDFKPIAQWLGQNIHAQGRLMGFDSLVKSATGKALSTKPLVRHLEERYLAA